MSTTTERLKAVVEVESGKAQAELLALDKRMDSLGKDRDAKIDVDLDPNVAGFNRELDTALAIKERTTSLDVKLNVKKDHLASLNRSLQASIPSFQAFAKEANKSKKSSDGLGGAVNSLTKRFLGFKAVLGALKLGAILSVIGPLTSALMGLGAAIVAVVGSLSRMVGLLAAMPSMISAIGQAAVGLKATFGGIGEAISGFTSDKAAGGGGGGGGISETIADVQRRAVMYKRSLEDAADAIHHAEERLEGIGELLTNAQKEEVNAQLELNKARADSIEYLDDLARASRGLANDEEAASIQLAESKRILAAANRDGGIPEKDLREAKLAVADAEQNLADIQDERQSLQEELNDATEKGIENSDIQKDRELNLAEAQAATTAILHDQEDAVRDLARAKEDQVYQIENEGKALAAAASGAGGGFSAFNDAMANLGPNAQEFVKQFIKVSEMFTEIKKKVQEEAIPGFTDLFKAFEGLMPALETGLMGTGTVLSAWAAGLADFFETDQFKLDFATILGLNNIIIEDMGTMFTGLIQGLTDLMVAAAPFTEWISSLIADFGLWFAETMKVNRENGKIEAFLDRVKGTMETFGGILENLAVTFGNIFGGGATALGDGLLTSLEDITAKWAEWTGSVEGQESIKEWFEGLRPTIDSLFLLLADLSELFVSIGDGDQGTGFLDALRESFIPALESLLTAFDEGDLGAKFVDLITAITNVLAQLADEKSTLSLFVEAITGFFNALSALLAIPGVAKTLGVLATSFAMLKIASIGLKITGISKLYGYLNSAKFLANAKSFGAFVGKIKLGFKGLGPRIMMGARAVGAFGKALLLNPVTLFIAALVLLGVAIYMVYQKWDYIKLNFKRGLLVIKWAFEDAFGRVKEVVGNVIGWVVDKVSGWADRFKDGLKKIKDFFGGLKDAILEKIGDAGEWLSEKAGQIWGGLQTGLTTAFDATMLWFGNLKQSILNKFSTAKDWIWQKGKDILDGLMRGLSWMWENGVKRFFALGDKVRSAMGSVTGWLQEKGQQILGGLKTGIMWFWDNHVKGFFSGFGTIIKNLITNPLTLLKDIGKNILDGLWTGMQSVWTEIKEWFTEIVNLIPDFLKEPLGINSPSKVMMQIGHDTMEGLKVGLDENSDLPASFMGLGEEIPKLFNNRPQLLQSVDSRTDSSTRMGDIIVNGYNREPEDIMQAAYWQMRTN